MVTVRTTWQRLSTTRGWRFADDWWTPQTDALITAVVAGDDLIGCCRRFGATRAAAGVGLGEALDDLWALFTVLHRAPAAAAVRTFVESYVASSLPGVAITECDDALTGFASAAYLRRRLGEAYAAAAGDGGAVARRHGLLHVRARAGSGWQDVTRRLALARLLDAELVRGETVAAVTTHDVVVLTRRPGPGARRLRAALGPAYEVRPLAVPATAAEAVERIDHLAASEGRTRSDEHTDVHRHEDRPGPAGERTGGHDHTDAGGDTR